ncbi:MAG: hypothetical protein WC145_13345 [Aliarcobacter sp.]|jgi:hypothetical protein
MKRCSRCRREQPLSAFYRSEKASDGRQAWCKRCLLTYQRLLRAGEDVRSGPKRRYPELADPAWLRQRYHQDLMTVTEIAATLGCTPTTVSSALRQHRIPILSHGERKILQAQRGVAR